MMKLRITLWDGRVIEDWFTLNTNLMTIEMYSCEGNTIEILDVRV